MNKTKRKIFEASMKLFAEKGYDATSIEEITATVGVAKGTLYYHFSSKEEIFNFLVEEGIKLLQNSIDIKTSKLPNYIDKLKAIILIQIKIVVKYEDIITILLTQFFSWFLPASFFARPALSILTEAGSTRPAPVPQGSSKPDEMQSIDKQTIP